MDDRSSPDLPRQFALAAYGPPFAEAAAQLESLVAPISPETLSMQFGLQAVSSLTEIALANHRAVGLLDVRSPDGERFVLRLVVALDARRQGLGRYLFQRAAAVASSFLPGAPLRARVRDDDVSSLAWAERRGLSESGHRISMSRPLSEGPAELDREAAAAMTRAEVTIARWPETSMADDWSLLTELLATCLIDSLDSAGVRATEETTRYIAPHPSSVLIALRDDKPIGMASIAPEGHALWNSWFTGVIPTARGNGVAAALKLAALALARREGASQVQTYNDVMNEPIIRLNESLGYERRPGIRLLRGVAIGPDSRSDGPTHLR